MDGGKDFRVDMGNGNGGYIRMLMLMRLITRPIDDYGRDSPSDGLKRKEEAVTLWMRKNAGI